MPLGMEICLSLGDFVFDGDLAPQKKGTAPHPILARVYCGQTAGWIKIPLGTEVNLGPGDVVLDGVTDLHVYCGQTAGCIKILPGTEVDLGPGHIALDGSPAPPRKGHRPSPSFRPVSIVATVAHLSYC